MHLRLIDMADLDHLDLIAAEVLPQVIRVSAEGTVGQEIILENDRVRIWHITLAPGETQPLHHHGLPYVVVAVQGASNVIQTAAGERIDVEEETGGVVFREPGADAHC